MGGKKEDQVNAMKQEAASSAFNHFFSFEVEILCKDIQERILLL